MAGGGREGGAADAIYPSSIDDGWRDVFSLAKFGFPSP
jgi:hypothetical protein